ncbi:MAG: DUF4298 domain-containing protein [Lachnospiraceae bacterium]|nr:DUF4298 domain-containing protein [Lachnospiraceae bacterium]
MNQIKRIREMEACLDISAAAVEALSEALDQYEAAQKSYKKLSDYYGSSRWMKDYEADEAGELPKDLKRGVLSEDAVYDLITENNALRIRMMKLLTQAMEQNLL